MTLTGLVIDVPMLVRVLVGLLGALLLVAGARWVRVGLAVAAFAIGTAATSSLLAAVAPFLPAVATPVVALPVALVGGAALLVLARMIERLAMLVAGGFTGLVVGLGLAAFLGVPAGFALVGAVIGALVFPWAWERLLRVVTALVGAGLVAWAVALPHEPILVVGLAVFGVVVQFASGGAPRRDDDDDEEDDA